MNELTVRRLVVQDDQNRPRVVIECGASPDPPRGAPVHLRLLAASGDPMLEIRLDEDGEPRLSVGHPDRGAAVIVLRAKVQVWEGGNETATLSASTSE